MNTLIAITIAALSIGGCAIPNPPDNARPCEQPVNYVTQSPDPTYVGPVWLDANGEIVAQVQSETDTTAVYVECVPDYAITRWFDSLDD